MLPVLREDAPPEREKEERRRSVPATEAREIAAAQFVFYLLSVK